MRDQKVVTPMTVYATIKAELMDHRRSDMGLILLLAITSCVVVSACWPNLAHAFQSQDAINAVTQERLTEVFRRLDSIENLVRGIFVLLISTLATLVVQIWNQRAGRKRASLLDD